MRREAIFVLLLCAVHAFAVQKIFRPNSTTILSEKVPEKSMGITIDVNVIEGQDLYIMSGMKNRPMEKIELKNVYKRNVEFKEPGEVEVWIINKGEEYANVSVSIYVDKSREETDEAEILRKLLEKVRGDLTSIQNDILKFKNINSQSLSKAKSVKSILWIICIFPLLYVFLSYLRLNIIKGFFSSKNPHRI
ncbi:hypothetical protein NECID01_1032 [Nematocida sp. AWRm77]|nr:hypothetical protein NECID01_1032 [Nematocida sp. AWRm77]